MPSPRRLTVRSVAGFLLAAATASAQNTITVTNGIIHGVRCNSSDVAAYLSIPFAKAPARFSAPQPYDEKYNNNGTLFATTPAPSCPQFGSQAFRESNTQSEDCLFLDVYVPIYPDAPPSKLPVKVWIYGGSNEGGGISDPTYTGCFAASGSIFVSINYRLGPLGYLLLPEANIMGNYGTLDQLAALQWVQDNIAAFGGDPSQVLVFGQSAGAIDTFVLSTLPQAGKLFSSAAMESGGGRDLPTTAEVLDYNTKYAAALNCSASDLKCLQGVSLSALDAADTATSNAVAGPDGASVLGADTLLENGGKGETWGPVFDGSVIAKQPSEVGLQVPSILGSNQDDGSLFVLGQYGARAFTLNETDYDAFLKNSFGSLASTVNETFPLSLFEAAIPPSLRASSPSAAYYAMVSIITDAGYACPAHRALESAASRGISAYAYRFNHTPSCAWYQGIPSSVPLLDLLGATHTAEIPFVLGLVSGLPPPSGNCSFTPSEVDISNDLLKAWTTMAANGQPTVGGFNLTDTVAWPTWNQSSSTGLLIGADGVSTGTVNFSSCAFWDKLEATIVSLDANSTSNSSSSSGTGTSSGSGSSSSPKSKNAAAKGVAIPSISSALLMLVSFVLFM